MKDGDVGWLKIAEVAIEVFIHMLEDRAILKGHAAQPGDVLGMPLLKDLIGNSQRFQQDNGLSIQETGLVLVPVEDVEVLHCCIVLAIIFHHALAHVDCLPLQRGIHHQNALCSLVAHLDHTQVFDLQTEADSFDEVWTDLADAVSVHVPLAGAIIIQHLLLDLSGLALESPRGGEGLSDTCGPLCRIVDAIKTAQKAEDLLADEGPIHIHLMHVPEGIGA